MRTLTIVALICSSIMASQCAMAQSTWQVLPLYGTIEYKIKKAVAMSPEKLVEWLKDDDIKGNAITAMNVLCDRNNNEVRTVLQQSLSSSDMQQRIFAGHILRRLQVEPTPDLLKVSVESLRSNNFPNHPRFQKKPWSNNFPNHPRFQKKPFEKREPCVFVFDAASSVRYLLKYPDQGTELLEQALDSDDMQQKFLAAFVLGKTARAAKVKKISSILIPHLKDDEISGNAIMAVHALYHLGTPVKPYLEPYLNSDDAQQAKSVTLVLKDIGNPPDTRSKQFSRMSIIRLSRRMSDPAVDERAIYYIGSVGTGIDRITNQNN